MTCNSEQTDAPGRVANNALPSVQMVQVRVAKRVEAGVWVDDVAHASPVGAPPQFEGLHVYCSCARPDTPDVWMFLLAPVTTPEAEPDHAPELPFPFTLPLFPRGPVWLAQARCGASASAVQLLLGTPPDMPVLQYLPLTGRQWQDTGAASWNECLRDREARLALLRHAFDRDWTATTVNVPDDDLVEVEVDADVLLRALLVPDALPSRRKPTAPAREDEVDDVAVSDVNAFTGLVFEDPADDGASDELDLNSEHDDDTDDDQDNDDDEDDEDDDAGDDDAPGTLEGV